MDAVGELRATRICSTRSFRIHFAILSKPKLRQPITWSSQYRFGFGAILGPRSTKTCSGISIKLVSESWLSPTSALAYRKPCSYANAKMAYTLLSFLVKLSLLETSFDAVAVQMQPWIEKMQTGLGVFFPVSAVFRKTGELFTLRHLLNISTTISETPDFYWDRPEVEKLFQNLKSALSVQSRTNVSSSTKTKKQPDNRHGSNVSNTLLLQILNSKLNTCCELTEILTNHLEARHSSRLEWMIIVLILVEVIFEFQHHYERKKWSEEKECSNT
uniref:DUF155 domain-containing protein n=1 Tax=Mesocestoides corti TaxID=53468 RepID=A0A5K3FDE3_MESCO